MAQVASKVYLKVLRDGSLVQSYACESLNLNLMFPMHGLITSIELFL